MLRFTFLAAMALGATGLLPAAIAAPTFQYATLAVPGALETQAYGVDDAGRVVGAYRDGGGLWHGFRWASGTFTTIDVPGAAYTDAFGIANNGTIVGTSSPLPQIGFDDFSQGYVLAGGIVTPLVVPGAVQTGAFGINGAGSVVGSYRSDPPVGGGFGYHGFVWTGGTFTTIDIQNAAGGIDDTAVIGINELGQMVGEYGAFCAGCAARSFLWDAGVVTTFAPFGATASGAFGINDDGDIVGWFGPDATAAGYLYADGAFQVIAPLGAVFSEAVDINNRGVIVGTYADASGAIFGYVATPVPEPATAALSLLGLLAVAGASARRRVRLPVRSDGA